MDERRVYSDRLGAIRDDQVVAVCTRLQLGTFLRAEPTTSGLFGQNVFVTTTEGEYVLRGAPHWVKDVHEAAYWPQDSWQFSKEAFFARQLHERTSAPVAWPYLFEDTTDIFGWPFAVMRRMPGESYNERSILRALEPEDRRQVALAMGETLAEMQRLTWDFAGDFDVRTIELAPYLSGYQERIIAELAEGATNSNQNGAWTPADQEWIDRIAASARAAGATRPNTFVHGDYKLNNLTVTPGDDGAWKVSGIFDLHEARFGDGALDLARQACSYRDTEPELMTVFAGAYFAHAPRDPALQALLPLYVVADRMRLWDYFSRPAHRAPFTHGTTFRAWAQPYVEAVVGLL